MILFIYTKRKKAVLKGFILGYYAQGKYGLLDQLQVLCIFQSLLLADGQSLHLVNSSMRKSFFNKQCVLSFG